MAKIKGLTFEQFKEECFEFYRQRSGYFCLLKPEVLKRLPNDMEDRGIWYFSVYVVSTATRKILMYDHTENDPNPFAVYEEWISPDPLETEPVTGRFPDNTLSQLILVCEYKDLESSFESMCKRSIRWRFNSTSNLVYIDYPKMENIDIKDEVYRYTRKLLPTCHELTMSEYIKRLNENNGKIVKGIYTVYIKLLGGFRQEFYKFRAN